MGLDWLDSSELDEKTAHHFSKLLFQRQFWKLIMYIFLFVCMVVLLCSTFFWKMDALASFSRTISIIAAAFGFVNGILCGIQLFFLQKGYFSWACGYFTDLDYGDPGLWNKRYAFLSDFKVPDVYVNNVRCSVLRKQEFLGFNYQELDALIGSPMVVVKPKFSLWPRYACFYEMIPK